MLNPRPMRNLEGASWSHEVMDRGRYAGGYKITLTTQGGKRSHVYVSKAEKHRTFSQNYIDSLFWKMMNELVDTKVKGRFKD